MLSTTHGNNLRILELEKQLEELKEAKKEKKDQFPHIVQMLILDYLGVGKHIESNYKKAEIYAPLIRRDLETTRQYFSKLNSEKTLKNLSLILGYFEKGGFPDQVKQVNNDIDRIKKRK